MSLAHVINHEMGPLYVSNAQPIVFVVHNDISVRESMKSLIRCDGWRSEAFAFAHEFLARPRPLVPNCLVLDVPLPDLNGLICKEGSQSNAPTRRLYSSRARAMCTRRFKP